MTDFKKEYMELQGHATDLFSKIGWHWFGYHFRACPMRPFAQAILAACAELEASIPGLGRKFLTDIAAVSNRYKHEQHYDQLMQRLSEILMIRQTIRLKWTEPPTYVVEPKAGENRKKLELLVSCSGTDIGLEVKTPAILDHQRKRAGNEYQLPGRALPREMIEMLAAGQPVTLPRDNPVKDFLASANEKFAGFKERNANFIGILAIVWDDYIYEPVTSLLHDRCGLLTEQSFAKDETGQPLRYPNLDYVVVVRHLSYLMVDAAERALPDREDGFDFGAAGALPNVAIRLEHARELPAFVMEGFRAVAWDDERLQGVADYRPQDIVFWLKF